MRMLNSFIRAHYERISTVLPRYSGISNKFSLSFGSLADELLHCYCLTESFSIFFSSLKQANF